MPKITFIGAGSTVFAKNLLGDILNYPELSESIITLFDIDEQRLAESATVAYHLVDRLKVNPSIETTTDRRAALDGADYAIAMFQIGGYKPSTVIDFEIPKKYGLRQTIGDTLGIGGIMRALRTIPPLLEMTAEMEALCPHVTFLNYVNPMAMNCWAMFRTSKIHTVGLCHSVPHTAAELAEDLNLPVTAINYLVAGINHVAFYLKFEDQHGNDLYPRLRQVISEGRVPDWNRVRYEVFRRLGYFVTESSEHFSEYVPWFIKRDRPDLIDKYNIPLDEYLGRCEAQIKAWEYAQKTRQDPARYNRANLARELEPLKMMPRSKAHALQSLDKIDEIRPSVEYGSQIIYAMESGQPVRIYGNVANHGLIDNLPDGCCVEVPCLVDKNGVQPVRIGSLPPQLAALMQTNINVQALTVEAALTRKRDHIYHAAMLDPHTAAELDLEQIGNLVDELIEAHGEWLPKYD
ncbi:MAG TPA: alpha-glucosidase/alpha-galactosidase [Anaerolineae bacterium]|nr:alpha-glucosidase/alpha-galactosidase [Anaerolineae bacterium]HMR63584.1 alpha-glucosidase/alpha-galactosidase [Anaerolineae bacterium]